MKGNKVLDISFLRYKKFNPFYGSFKVHTKAYKHGEHNKLASRIFIYDNRTIDFRVRDDERIMISLEEDIFDDSFYTNKLYPHFMNKKQQYTFMNENIKEISFIHELDKFYIVLVVNVSYFIDDVKKKKCGIDLGIHNPVTVFDGEGIHHFSMSKKQISRIAYLNRRSQRLQQILDNKYRVNNRYANKEVSKNYRKVQKKLRITNRKIFNIRMNWRKKVCSVITKHYDIFCVDQFKQPTSSTHDFYNVYGKHRHFINYNNRNHAMDLFYKYFSHSVIKTGGKLIESPKNTTRTCCMCGHKNKKLLLTERFLVCEKCGEIVDRDTNAAINCYNCI